MTNSRRDFLKLAAKYSVGGVVFNSISLSSIAAMRRYVSPNEKINFGLIGANGMGWADMRSILKNSEANCIAICDVDANVLKKRAKDCKEITGKKPKVYGDYRKLLENKDVDAVVIGTPDHWHCLNLVDSLQAGKHAYCEKPIANSIEESFLMNDAVKKYNKIVQVGQWQRSGIQYKDALDFLWSGKLGDIRLVKVWAYQGWYGWVDDKPDTDAPKGVNYNMWLGPAPMRKFNENRFHFNFRWYWDYAGGLMTDWGVHEIDIALYGMKAKNPVSVMASGGKFGYPDQDTDTPDTLQTVFEYDDFTMLWEHANGIDGGNYGRDEGISFIGNKATLVVNRGGWEVISEIDHRRTKKPFMESIPKIDATENALDSHTKNFLEAMKNNSPGSLKCDLNSGSIACINSHMGNIAYKTGEKIYWDRKNQAFIDNPKANKLIKSAYNNGWKLPSV